MIHSTVRWNITIIVIILKHVIQDTGDIIINYSNIIIVSYSGDRSRLKNTIDPVRRQRRIMMIKLIPTLSYGHGNERLANDVTRWIVGIGGGGWKTCKVVKNLSDHWPYDHFGHFLNSAHCLYYHHHNIWYNLHHSITLDIPLYSACRTYILVLSIPTLLDSSICIRNFWIPSYAHENISLRPACYDLGYVMVWCSEWSYQSYLHIGYTGYIGYGLKGLILFTLINSSHAVSHHYLPNE